MLDKGVSVRMEAVTGEYTWEYIREYTLEYTWKYTCRTIQTGAANIEGSSWVRPRRYTISRHDTLVPSKKFRRRYAQYLQLSLQLIQIINASEF